MIFNAKLSTPISSILCNKRIKNAELADYIKKKTFTNIPFIQIADEFHNC